MITCEKCKMENPDSNKHCGDCGSALAPTRDVDPGAATQYLIAQAGAILAASKRDQWIGGSAGVLAFVGTLAALGPNAGGWVFPLASFLGVGVFLGLWALVLPALFPPSVPCPYCGVRITALRNRVPRMVWPGTCPRCHRKIV